VKQFVIYTRVSTKRQGDSGLGLAAQLRDIQIYLETYADTPYEVIGQFQDILSGTNDDRPALAQAVALAEKTGATLLVAKLDRLSRKVSVVSALMDRKKLSIVVVSMPQADKFQLHIYSALAEQERTFISLRTRAALAPLRGTGKLGSAGRGNIAAANAGARVVADAYAARVMDTIRPLRQAGLTLQQIANTLNTTKVATTKGGRWYPTTVSNILKRLGD